jgi:hypothetical protein
VKTYVVVLGELLEKIYVVVPAELVVVPGELRLA